MFSAAMARWAAAHYRESAYFMGSRLVRTGITLHLRCIIPAGALAGLQFIPAIRRYSPAAHRINGYITMVLGLIGAVAAIVVAPYAFGGDLAGQAAAMVLMSAFLVAQCKAYGCVRRRQIELHRAWMLRSWSYASAVITQRVVMPLSATLITLIGGYSLAQPCDKIDSVLKDYDNMVTLYPACSTSDTGRTTGQSAIVDANINSDDIMQLVTAFNLTYGMSSWMTLTIHAICAELYLSGRGGSAQPKPLRHPDSCYSSCNTEET
ncbi:hypothetical protein GGR55DRAFT_147154 [Xylaria sp. FL0064]|nr:hypothetical protein GGR55DRAFT_147154 [Xylaria sp. FL0064]